MAQLGVRLLHAISGRRIKRIALVFFVLVSFLMALSWSLLPSYVKRMATEQAQQQLGRKLEIAEISFSPLSLTLTAKGVSLFEVDQKTPMLTLKNADLSLSISSLFHLALVMDEVQLDEPSLHVVRTSADGYGQYNFSDILDRVAAMPKSSSPFHFSFANVQVQGGQIKFDDVVLDKHIQVDALQIGLPFLSNFPKSTNSFVQPSLSAKINGTTFALKGRSKPFIDSLETSLAIDIDQLDLPSYVAYVPLPLPVTPQSAKLSTKLDLIFSRKNHQAELLLSGDVQLDMLALKDKTEHPLLTARSIKTHIQQLNVLNPAASIENLHIDTPEIWISLNEKGQLNWDSLLPAANQSTRTGNAVSTKLVKTEPVKAIFSFAQLRLDHGQLHLTDALHATPAQAIQLREMTLSAKQFSTAADAKPALVSFSAQGEQSQGIKFDGEFNPGNGNVAGSVSLEALQLARYQGWIDRFLAAKLSGVVSLKTKLGLQQGRLKLDQLAVQLDGLMIKPHAKNEGQLAINSASLEQLSLDTESRTIKVASLDMTGLQLDLWRDAQSRLSVGKLIVPVTQTAPSSLAPLSTANGASARQSDWLVTVQNFTMNKSDFFFTDGAVTPAVKTKAEAISFSADNLSSDLSQTINMKWVSTVNRKGKLLLTASATPHLRKIIANIDGQSLPVASLYPYFSHLLNVELLSGHTSLKGKLSLQNDEGKNLVTNYEGTLSLNDFKILEKGESDDFLYWKTISLDGINLSLGAAKQFVFLRQLSLNDFYTKLILSEKGELNIRDIVVPQDATTSPPKNPALSDSPGLVQSVSVVNIPVAATANERKLDYPIEIRVAQTKLKGGNINFTDNFVKPNYSANLTEVRGTIGAVSSLSTQAAAVELEGKIDDEAPLLISGSVNPLSKPVFVDIKGSANGIQMTRLSPYAAKYAGYPIIKGHLSAQVAYHLDHEKLTAENAVRLDQLTFGDKVESPEATTLPVKLAMALLRDNAGNIAVDLPISGSLSDPQFSIGGIIFKVFMNIVTKAVTAPFALLGTAFGGGEELAFVEFAPGRSDLSPTAIGKLDHLIKALKERSSLKLDIAGRVDPKTDADGLRLENVDSKIKIFKLRDLKKKNSAIQAEEISIEEADRIAYVEEVYRAENFTKQRNLLGIAKTLPAKEAMVLILNHTTVTPENLRSLAQQRADVVLDYVEQQGAISKDRLFLVAPKLNADDLNDKGLPNRVDFSLK